MHGSNGMHMFLVGTSPVHNGCGIAAGTVGFVQPHFDDIYNTISIVRWEVSIRVRAPGSDARADDEWN